MNTQETKATSKSANTMTATVFFLIFNPRLLCLEISPRKEPFRPSSGIVSLTYYRGKKIRSSGVVYIVGSEKLTLTADYNNSES